MSKKGGTMVEERKNSQLANQIYLLISVLNIVFMAYFVFRFFQLDEMLNIGRNSHSLILLGFIIGINLLNRYAKNNGGFMSPMRSNKKARIINFVSLGFFVLGILLGPVLQLNQGFIYLSVASLPLLIYATYLAHNKVFSKFETDLVDDFEINEFRSTENNSNEEDET